MSFILLQGGTLLVPGDATDSVVAVKQDLLICKDRIAGIGQDIAPGDGTVHLDLVDCTNKIISPGFIDTHHHLWQTQLKGRHGDHTLLDYMPSGNLSGSFYTPSDVFWGQLGGALEALDAGTTTVVDQAHMNYSEQHCKCP
jgi:cytosine/adenosine deaminase-related metal-dependent hydrolase